MADCQVSARKGQHQRGRNQVTLELIVAFCRETVRNVSKKVLIFRHWVASSSVGMNNATQGVCTVYL